jgi:hypothetical protein
VRGEAPERLAEMLLARAEVRAEAEVGDVGIGAGQLRATFAAGGSAATARSGSRAIRSVSTAPTRAR